MHYRDFSRGVTFWSGGEFKQVAPGDLESYCFQKGTHGGRLTVHVYEILWIAVCMICFAANTQSNILDGQCIVIWIHSGQASLVHHFVIKGD